MPPTMPRKGQLLKTRKRAAVKPAGPAHNQMDPLAGKLLVRYMEEHFEIDRNRIEGFAGSTHGRVEKG